MIKKAEMATRFELWDARSGNIATQMPAIPGLRVVRSSIDGYGVVATRDFAAGEIISFCTAIPPALSPKMVTFPGSPPNAEIFRFTHSSEAIMSIMP